MQCQVWLEVIKHKQTTIFMTPIGGHTASISRAKPTGPHTVHTTGQPSKGRLSLRRSDRPLEEAGKASLTIPNKCYVCHPLIKHLLKHISQQAFHTSLSHNETAPPPSPWGCSPPPHGGPPPPPPPRGGPPPPPGGAPPPPPHGEATGCTMFTLVRQSSATE